VTGYGADVYNQAVIEVKVLGGTFTLTDSHGRPVGTGSLKTSSTTHHVPPRPPVAHQSNAPAPVRIPPHPRG
jgi:hypothetical protein